ncbi:MAG: hypothetical protein LBC82_07980 [Oscillospiraceae bacterium]|nr:hypothetical protein [Oscillospiraceae bacterium]
MTSKDLARRTEIAVKINGVEISADVNKYLISMTYTDNDEDKSDDVRIELDDREGIWLEWLKTVAQSNSQRASLQTAAPVTADSGGDFKIGEIVQFKGGLSAGVTVDLEGWGVFNPRHLK